MGYAKHYARHGKTPQSQRAKRGQKKNHAGGFVFELDRWGRLDRFLILGVDGGSYYARERSMLTKNERLVRECLTADGLRVVARVVEISTSGRAPKQEPALFCLALAAAAEHDATRKAALDAVPGVCRTSTHLFTFVDTVRRFRGFGRGLRRAVCAWYFDRTPESLAYQALKYKRRGGYSHRDVLRLAGGAMGPRSVAHDAVLRWVVAGSDGFGRRVVERDGVVSEYGAVDRSALPAIVDAAESLQYMKDPADAAVLIDAHQLTHEMVPSELKGHAIVWEALLAHMPMTAMLRNLGKLSSVGVLGPFSAASDMVAARFGDVRRIERARIHPLSVLVALNTYRKGHGVRGKLSWTAVPQVVDALDCAFYSAFRNIRPSGKRTLLALDVSGSMGWSQIAGMTGVTPRIGAAAMAMATVRTEAAYHTMAFSHRLVPVTLSKRMRLDQVVQTLARVPMGGTDCALPMKHALKERMKVDAFVVYTDNETWFGGEHPFEALRRYRDTMGIDAKLIVVGMTATEFTIADPDDAGMLDIVGFDASAPALMADFIADRG